MKNTVHYSTTQGERISYGLFFFGGILGYYLIASFFQLYLTNIGIPAAAVGLIFIGAKVWDAVNDPIFGVIVDKAHFKKGKFLPWLRVAVITTPIATMLMFLIPTGVSLQIKIIWATLAYILWDASSTLYDVPANALVTSMTENLQERNKLYSYNAFFVYLGGLIIAIAVPMLFPKIGWGATAILIGVVSMATMIFLPYKAKERFSPKSKKEVSIKELLSFLFRNKYLLIFTLAAIVGSITDLATALNGYFAIYCLGGEFWITPLSLAIAVPVLLASLFVPKLFVKHDKFKINIITRLASILVNVVIYLTGYGNIVLLLSLIVIRQLFAAVWGISSIMFVADCVEYGQFITGARSQGVTFSLKAFTNKIVVALSGSLAMFGLAAYGFISGTGAVQSQETINGIWFLYSFAPIIGSILAVVILLLFYKLRDRDVQLMTRCNNGEISREEAQAGFTKRY